MIDDPGIEALIELTKDPTMVLSGVKTSLFPRVEVGADEPMLLIVMSLNGETLFPNQEEVPFTLNISLTPRTVAKLTNAMTDLHSVMLEQGLLEQREILDPAHQVEHITIGGPDA